MKKLLIAVALMVSTIYAQNLVSNGDFSNGQTGWLVNNQQEWYDGEAETNTFIQDGELYIEPVTSGQFEWEAAISTVGIPLVQGRTYELSFDVRLKNATDGYRPITVEVKSDWDLVGNITYFEEYGVPIEDGTYTCRFTMINPSDANSSVAVTFGHNEKPIIFDNFTLREVAQGYIPELTFYSVPYEVREGVRPMWGWIGRDDSGIREYRYCIDNGSWQTVSETSFEGATNLAAGEHTFRLIAISNTGEQSFECINTFTVDGTVSNAAPVSRAASGLTIIQTESTVNLRINETEPVGINITDLRGRLIHSTTQTPVNSSITLNKADMGIAAGIYIMNITTLDVTRNLRITF